MILTHFLCSKNHLVHLRLRGGSPVGFRYIVINIKNRQSYERRFLLVFDHFTIVIIEMIFQERVSVSRYDFDPLPVLQKPFGSQ